MVLLYSTAIAPAPGPGGRRYTPMTTLVSAETPAPPVIAAPTKAPGAASQGAASQGAASQGAASQDKGLRAGALGLLSSVVIAVSSTAPAYSMAATLGLIVAVVGVHS